MGDIGLVATCCMQADARIKYYATTLHIFLASINSVQLLLHSKFHLLPLPSDIKQVADITDCLVDMQRDNIYNLGLALRLDYTKLKDMMGSHSFREDVIAAWLQKEDNVREEPTWTVLIEALKDPRVKQMGIANKIAKDRGLS